jgi:acyl carrier protein
MLPAAYVVLPALPLTVSGKLDRKALPDPGPALAETAAAFVPPRSDAERELAAIWREILGREEVGVHDNFFELGGDSLRLFRVHLRIKEVFGKELPVADLFRFPTIGELARSLAGEVEEEEAAEEVGAQRAARRAAAGASRSRSREQRRAARPAEGEE